MAFDSSSGAAEDPAIARAPLSNDATSLSVLRKELFEAARSPRRLRSVQAATGLWECGQPGGHERGQQCDGLTRPVDIPVELEQQLPVDSPLEIEISKMMVVRPTPNAA
eukprot:CAMPEP_0119353574 /NCGR_PEP_ID=MMETSP1334-20130426/2684_1 /TAXON_ID=127549 /ORGANISM="Calcidiscus leptoporus, Strain RCC1130" /LENGTH=108 /DNA_ID=CAMNT_0007366883 /DNA_START=241 /DNA_END=567 /DNA_ORIENTATION=-